MSDKVRSQLPRKKNRKLKVKLRRKLKKIIIDKELGWEFGSEKEVLKHFAPEVVDLEEEFLNLSKNYQAAELDSKEVDRQLDLTLDEPHEIWCDEKRLARFPLFLFVRRSEELDLFHLVFAYVSSEDEPTFIFLHFFTQHKEILQHYRRGQIIYDRAFEEIGFAAVDGDALMDGDPLAMGLFLAMLKVRSEKDIPHSRFKELAEKFRPLTIENPDEIWRNQEHGDAVLVTFIHEVTETEEDSFFYLVVTQEEPDTNAHSLLFSFPTNDETLVDRYRHGENLQAEEVSQESAH